MPVSFGLLMNSLLSPALLGTGVQFTSIEVILRFVLCVGSLAFALRGSALAFSLRVGGEGMDHPTTATNRALV